jgi:hypothetical protein
MKSVWQILDSTVCCCIHPKPSYDRGTMEWDMVVHRYVHFHRLTVDLEQSMAIQITTRLSFVVVLLGVYAVAFYKFPKVALIATLSTLLLVVVAWLVVGRWFKQSPRAAAEKELADWVAHCRFQNPNHPSVTADIQRKRVELYAKHGVVIS